MIKEVEVIFDKIHRQTEADKTEQILNKYAEIEAAGGRVVGQQPIEKIQITIVGVKLLVEQKEE